MAGLIKIQCPKCKSIHSVADSYLYQKVRCPKCDTEFVVYDDITPQKPVSSSIEKPSTPKQLNKETWIVLVSLLCIGIAVFVYYNHLRIKKKCIFSEAQKQLVRDAMREANLLDSMLLDKFNSAMQEKKLHAALQAWDEIKKLPNMDVFDDLRISTLQLEGYGLCWDADSLRMQLEFDGQDKWKLTIDRFKKSHDEFSKECLQLLKDYK